VKKTIKVIAVALAIPAALVVLLIAFLNWTKNPYGLETARLGPKGKEKLPSIAPIANATNYLLFPRHQDNAFVIHLPIPKDYFHPSNWTSRFKKSYAASVTMYYPAMHGVLHPDNAHLLTCKGYCEGYMRAFIEASGRDARAQDARKVQQIQKDRSGSSPLYRFEDLDRAFGLDDHFQIRYPVGEEKPNGSRSSTKEYLFKRDQAGDVQYLLECLPYTPSPGCTVRFNLSSRPELLVDVTFGRHLLENWQDIISSVDRTIASWGPARVDTVLEE
jgi:hypothetical protein